MVAKGYQHTAVTVETCLYCGIPIQTANGSSAFQQDDIPVSQWPSLCEGCRWYKNVISSLHRPGLKSGYSLES